MNEWETTTNMAEGDNMWEVSTWDRRGGRRREGEFRYEDTENLLKNISTRTPKLNSLLRWSSFEMIGKRRLAVPNIFFGENNKHMLYLEGLFLISCGDDEKQRIPLSRIWLLLQGIVESVRSVCVCSDVEMGGGGGGGVGLSSNSWVRVSEETFMTSWSFVKSVFSFSPPQLPHLVVYCIIPTYVAVRQEKLYCVAAGETELKNWLLPRKYEK